MAQKLNKTMQSVFSRCAIPRFGESTKSNVKKSGISVHNTVNTIFFVPYNEHPNMLNKLKDGLETISSIEKYTIGKRKCWKGYIFRNEDLLIPSFSFSFSFALIPIVFGHGPAGNCGQGILKKMSTLFVLCVLFYEGSKLGSSAIYSMFLACSIESFVWRKGKRSTRSKKKRGISSVWKSAGLQTSNIHFIFKR